MRNGSLPVAGIVYRVGYFGLWSPTVNCQS